MVWKVLDVEPGEVFHWICFLVILDMITTWLCLHLPKVYESNRVIRTFHANGESFIWLWFGIVMVYFGLMFFFTYGNKATRKLFNFLGLLYSVAVSIAVANNTAILLIWTFVGW